MLPKNNNYGARSVLCGKKSLSTRNPISLLFKRILNDFAIRY